MGELFASVLDNNLNGRLYFSNKHVAVAVCGKKLISSPWLQYLLGRIGCPVVLRFAQIPRQHDGRGKRGNENDFLTTCI